MSLWFCVLGSGSAGNCTLVVCETPAGSSYFLIDIGLSPRATANRMKPLGMRLQDISAIFLTHLDGDHFNNAWLKVIEGCAGGMRIHLHHRHRSAAWRCGLTMKNAQPFNDTIQLQDGPYIAGIMLAHDDLGSTGYVIEHAGLRLGYATDLGRVSDGLLDQFVNLDALAIESNYDRQMQLDSGRPVFLKRRIMGGNGHLSNEQSLEAVQRIDACSRLSHVVLLHLSRHCNDPRIVHELYARRAPHLRERLTIADQYEPSAMLRISRGPACARPLVQTRSALQMLLFGAADGASRPAVAT